MQIVIDIDENCYKDCKTMAILSAEQGQPRLGYIYEKIADGTPLPKWHGRLMILSEDKLKDNQINLDVSCQKWISEVGLSNATVAIIEADRCEENGNVN